MLHTTRFTRAACAAVVTGSAIVAGGSVKCCAGGSLPVPRVDSAEDVASTRWIKLQTLTYTDKSGKSRKWDMASRTTKPASASTDAVVILPLLRRADSPLVETLVVEQFRPPVRRTTVELQAGLIDDGESAVEAALRELKEETGYVGRATRASMELALSPGMTDESVQLVLVEVDLDAPENRKPTQMLEDGENIVVKRIPLARLAQELNVGSGMPFQGVYMLALGLELGAGLGGNEG